MNFTITLLLIFLISFVLFGVFGILGLSICKRSQYLKKNINKRNMIVISIIYMAFIGITANQGLTYGFGNFLLPYFASIFVNLLRNKFKRVFDKEFYFILLGSIVCGAIVQIFSINN
jgi:hypothetical protein|tara:strand:+ start:263 stop:613 length:351 start_codon:yes stop_codon:yes gene_type:complete